MKRFTLTLIVALILIAGGRVHAAEKPNIILILAERYRLQRLRVLRRDKLAAQGLQFTDAHAPSAVCTPTGRRRWQRN